MLSISYFEIVFLELDTRGNTKYIQKQMFDDLFKQI